MMEFSPERRPSAAMMVRVFAEWMERSRRQPPGGSPAESGAPLLPLGSEHELPPPMMVFDLVEARPAVSRDSSEQAAAARELGARGLGDGVYETAAPPLPCECSLPDASADNREAPRLRRVHPQKTQLASPRPARRCKIPVPAKTTKTSESPPKQKMNVIDDTVVTFAGGDDENGNQQEVEASECTDGDDSTSAPVELLAEFLSAILQRNYHIASEYCEKILKYEPNNSVAREFWPLIQLRVADDNNECIDADSGEEDEEGTDRDAGSNEEDVEESEDTKYYEEDETDGDEEVCEEDPDEESGSELGVTYTSDGTTDNFSLDDEDEDHSSNNEVKKTDSNGNNTTTDVCENKVKKKMADTRKHKDDTTTSESVTSKFQNTSLEQLRAQFVNGGK